MSFPDINGLSPGQPGQEANLGSSGRGGAAGPLSRPLLSFLGALTAVLWALAFAHAATFEDDAGRVITVEQPFRRIISLYPAHTENLASLGLDEEVIGIGPGDDHPERLLSRPRFSYREDPERFIGARPDLVLTRPMIERGYPQLIAKLERAGIVVVSLQPTSMDEIFAYWQKLGLLTGREPAAAAMISAFQRQLAAIRSTVAAIPPERRRRVYFSAIHRQMKTFAPESIAMFVLEEAGGRNVATDAPRVRQTNIAEYGKERLLAKGAEIEIFLAQQGRMNPVSRAAILREPGFGAIRAVREGAVHLIGEPLVSRPTLRIIEGIRQVADLLYPGLLEFPDQAGESSP